MAVAHRQAAPASSSQEIGRLAAVVAIYIFHYRYMGALNSVVDMETSVTRAAACHIMFLKILIALKRI